MGYWRDLVLNAVKHARNTFVIVTGACPTAGLLAIRKLSNGVGDDEELHSFGDMTNVMTQKLRISGIRVVNQLYPYSDRSILCQCVLIRK